MVSPNAIGANLVSHGQNQVGSMCSSIRTLKKVNLPKKSSVENVDNGKRIIRSRLD